MKHYASHPLPEGEEEKVCVTHKEVATDSGIVTSRGTARGCLNFLPELERTTFSIS